MSACPQDLQQSSNSIVSDKTSYGPVGAVMVLPPGVHWARGRCESRSGHRSDVERANVGGGTRSRRVAIWRVPPYAGKVAIARSLLTGFSHLLDMCILLDSAANHSRMRVI